METALSKMGLDMGIFEHPDLLCNLMEKEYNENIHYKKNTVINLIKKILVYTNDNANDSTPIRLFYNKIKHIQYCERKNKLNNVKQTNTGDQLRQVYDQVVESGDRVTLVGHYNKMGEEILNLQMEKNKIDLKILDLIYSKKLIKMQLDNVNV